MKTIKLTLLILFFPHFFFGQTLTGLWTGSISNDSTTVRKDQSFEMVLTQYKDKVYGYSRNEFIVNDTLYYIVKRVKGTIEGDICEVKDDEIISYNFRGRLDKGVKVITTFRLDQNDSTWKMGGEWKTNKTKKFYSISGKADLKEEKDLSKSKIFPHLEELKLTDDVAFYKESKKAQEPVVTSKQPAKNIQKEQINKGNNPINVSGERNTEVAISAKQPVAKEGPLTEKDKATTDRIKAVSPPTVKQPERVDQKEQLPKKSEPAAAREVKPENNTVTQGKSENKQPLKEIKTETVIKEDISLSKKQQPQNPEATVAAKPAEQKKEVAITATDIEVKKQPATQPASLFKETDKPSNNTTVEMKSSVFPAAALVAERKISPPQIVNFKSDSLELALYDNGEVDGDTVSVLLNGEIILAKQGLKSAAIKKTIYVPSDSVTMVLYAENLGKYPPNTGLLIIHDGDETYQIRFSADLQQNAAVIFKRKRR
jgi:hypothetical protein